MGRSRSSRGPSTCRREPEPLGAALADALGRAGIELYVGQQATAARRDGEEYILDLDDGRELREIDC